MKFMYKYTPWSNKAVLNRFLTDFESRPNITPADKLLAAKVRECMAKH